MPVISECLVIFKNVLIFYPKKEQKILLQLCYTVVGPF
jgi:hypothetical protein